MELNIGNTSVILEITSVEAMMLLLLVGLTSATYMYMRKVRKERTIKLGNFDTIQEVQERKEISTPLVLIIKILTVSLLFVVATGSLQIMTVQPVPDTDFAVVMDSSQAMMAPDYEPNRLEYSKNVITDWTQRLPDTTKIDIIEMGGGATYVEGEDHMEALENIDGGADKVGRSIGEAIILATNQLDGTENRGQIIVVTSGENNIGKNISEAVDEVPEDIQVDFIGLTASSETQRLYEELEASLNETEFDSEIEAPEVSSESLQQQAERTGGNYHSITENPFDQTMEQLVMEEESQALDSSYYILLFLTLLIISEMLIYSKYGAI